MVNDCPFQTVNKGSPEKWVCHAESLITCKMTLTAGKQPVCLRLFVKATTISMSSRQFGQPSLWVCMQKVSRRVYLLTEEYCRPNENEPFKMLNHHSRSTTCLSCALLIILHHFFLLPAHREDISEEQECLHICLMRHSADCTPGPTPMSNT